MAANLFFDCLNVASSKALNLPLRLLGSKAPRGDVVESFHFSLPLGIVGTFLWGRSCVTALIPGPLLSQNAKTAKFK
jgi:hypothetical protein